MSSETIFRIQLVLGYVAWLLCFSVYLWPRLKAMDRFDAQRAIATLHSFRFFGLVFILVCLALEHWLARRRSLDWVNNAFFRLNAVISSVFLVVTLTEIVFPFLPFRR